MSTVVSVRQSGTTIFSQPRRAAGGSCGARHVRGLGVAAAARPLARSFDASDCAPTDEEEERAVAEFVSDFDLRKDGVKLRDAAGSGSEEESNEKKGGREREKDDDEESQ